MNELSALSVSHKRAAVDEISRLTERSPRDLLNRLIEAGAREAYVLHTCNRAEYYVAGPREALEAAVTDLDLPPDLVVRYQGREAARHLLRVAAGLESMVVGEDEILGQVSAAREAAIDALDGTLGPVVEKAIRVGKRVRSETRINEGNASIGTAAAELASRELEAIEASRAIVIGAGEMGKLVAQPLADRGVDLLVTNRTYESAKELADRVNGTPICFEAISSRIEYVDMVVSATDAPHPILDRGSFGDAEVIAMDLANPPDVTPAVAALESVTVYDIDDVGAIVDSTMEKRSVATATAESIVAEELEALGELLKQREAENMLATIYERAESLKRAEVERATDRLERNGGLTPHEREVVEELGSALVNKLLSTPTRSIKQAAVAEDYETLRAVADVFEVPEDESAESATDPPAESRPAEGETGP